MNKWKHNKLDKTINFRFFPIVKDAYTNDSFFGIRKKNNFNYKRRNVNSNGQETVKCSCYINIIDVGFYVLVPGLCAINFNSPYDQ